MSSLSIPTTKSMNRRNSLRLPPQPPPAPVPPSLIRSPYLNSPLFSNGLTSPRIPSEQDEMWLQDTVPISESRSPDASSGAADRRGSVVHPPARQQHGLGISMSGNNSHSYPRTPSGSRTPGIEGLPPPSSYFSPGLSTSGRSRGTSNSHLASHSLAPPHDPFLSIPVTPGIGYVGRPVKLNQTYSTPNVTRVAGSNTDHPYTSGRPPQPRSSSGNVRS